MDRRVAIIGHSFRFPGCDPATFWQALLDGQDLVSEVSPDRWAQEVFTHPDKRHPGTSYTQAAGTLGDVAGFDAAFFGISPREARHMDPQQRLLLELSWEAMERAGIPPSRLRGSDCGVFMGVSGLDYASRYADDPAAIDASTATGTAVSIAANRLSYWFDLHGPSMALDTACSSSLVAFHQACQAIRHGEATTALAGGISLHLHPFGFLGFAKAGMLSPTGRCHVFDASGDGYVRSEGGGVVLLKALDQALSDGDPIQAVVSGSGINTDGSKSSLTVPNGTAQTALMQSVYGQAGIQPDALHYLEAHGTGTAVGDPIEAEAIAQALAAKRHAPLPVGSIKSNLGHLEMASGMAGLMKALYALRYRQVPPTIGLQEPNPRIDFRQWNLEVVTKTRPLPEQGRIFVGVNSFGFGGANAHVILESPPEERDKPHSREGNEKTEHNCYPLRLTARSQEALQAMAGSLAGYLRKEMPPLPDVAWTLHHHREHHSVGLLLMASETHSAGRLLERFAVTGESEMIHGLFTGERTADAAGPVFVYSGNGCQWRGMGERLMAGSTPFRKGVEEVDSHFQSYSDLSLVTLLAEPSEQDWTVLTEFAQPALFALQVGLTRHFQAAGVLPVAAVGHSVGEVAAAWAAGALSLEDAVRVIYYRSHYQAKTAGSGGMTAVALSEERLRELLEKPPGTELSLAGINSPRGMVVAGPMAALEYLEAELEGMGERYKRLPLDYAFHSPLMMPIRSGVLHDLKNLKPRKPQIPLFSTVTGGEVSGPILDADYWWQNIREPVRFGAAVEAILARGENVFVEIGGHPVLRGYLHETMQAQSHDGLVIDTLLRDEGEPERLQQSVARIMLSGVPFAHAQWLGTAGRFIELPTYPWQREPYRIPVTKESMGLLERRIKHPLLGYTLPHQNNTWENELDTVRQHWLADHVVGEGAVFPGAGFVELALAAAEQTQTKAAVLDVEELEILAPLLLSDEQWKRIQTHIDSGDGRVTIRSRQLEEVDEWTSHLRGRVMPETAGTLLRRKGSELPQRAPDFLLADHLQQAEQIGLKYGPHFQCISQGWVEGETALGIFAPADEVAEAVGDFLLYPGLLDSAFQLFIQLLGDELTDNPGIAFVPTHVGRIQLDRTWGGHLPAVAQVRLRRRLPHSLLTDVEIFGANGEAVAVLDEVRFKAVPLRKHAQHTLRFLDFELVPVPLRHHGGAGLQPRSEIVRELVEGFQEAEGWQAYGSEVEPLLDSLIEGFVLEGLSGQDRQSAALQQKGQSALSRLRERARESGWLVSSEQGDEWQIPTEPEVPPELIWNTLLREYPDYFELLRLAGRFGAHLRREWTDPSAETGFQLGAKQYAQALHAMSGQRAARRLALRMAMILQEQQDQLTVGERLTILEMGASQPLLGEIIAHQLDLGAMEYAFVSPNADALDEARTVLESVPLARTVAWDPASGELDMFLPPGNWLIVHLDFMQPQESVQILQALPKLAAEDAYVLLLGNHPALWLEWVLALSEADASIQRSADYWLEQLSNLGYRECVKRDLQADGVGQFLIGARVPQVLSLESGTAERWLLVADSEEPLAEKLGDLLKKQGHSVHYTPPDEESVDAALVPTGSDAVYIDRLVYLAGWAEADPIVGQAARCQQLARLSALAEDRGVDAECWVVTAGVADMFPSVETREEHTEAPPADAVTWGFVRTLMNESSALHFRLLDLPSLPFHGQPLAALVDTLVCADAEDEVLLTADGGRWSPRLRMAAYPGGFHERPDADDRSLTLGFQLPGQLRNLRWRPVPDRMPAEGEVAVAVKATGLNFRDVMYALGMLSDEAIENGFSGPTLGLEFAGEVVGIGAGVTEYAVGDAVLGFGPASFSTKVCASVTALTRMPSGMSFEAAATIPTTFFTVYYALNHLARLQAGERILIHGAAGGVGVAAIQVAQWMGAEIHATAGSQDKRDFLRLLGVEHLYDSRSHIFAEELLASTPDGRGVDVVLNSLAGEAINQNLRALNPFGRFLELGKRDFYENTAVGLRPFRNNLSYFGIDSDQILATSPALTKQLFDEVMALFRSGDLYPLPYTRFEADQVVNAFRYMQQARQIGKLVVSYTNRPSASIAEPPPSWGSLRLSPRASYLVTGGLGGFGLRTARWLVEKGARQLILLGRRGIRSEEARQTLEQFAEQGVEVVAEACDVTNYDAVERVLAGCRERLDPVRGVVHAAAVIEDALARNLDDTQIKRVLAPKVGGAWVLHKLLHDLDFFVLYSSATTLFGNPGQSSYVAANHWLEALARYRNQQGLPATCVRWAAIDDVGFLARNTRVKQSLQGRMGGSALRSDVALAALEQIMQKGCVVQGVMELDWPALSRFLPTAQRPKYREIAPFFGKVEQNDEAAVDLEELLLTLPPEALLEHVSTMLRTELSSILLIPEEKIGLRQPVYEMGFDSLMGVELMTSVESRFGVQLPVMALGASTTLESLAERIIHQLKKADDVEGRETQDAAMAEEFAARHGVEWQGQT